MLCQHKSDRVLIAYLFTQKKIELFTAEAFSALRVLMLHFSGTARGMKAH